MKKILWLPSWYPSKINPFTGDFIQRHAAAVSLFQPLVVIYLIKDQMGVYTKDVFAEFSTRGGLQEIIVYYKPFSTGIGAIDRLLSSAKYLSVYKQYIKKFILDEGVPAYIHVHVPVRAGVLARWSKKKWGIPFIVTEHWCAYNHLNPENFFTRSKLFRLLSKKIFESADTVTTVCESNRKELLAIFNIQKTAVINNVADSRLFYFREELPGRPFVFIHVSSLTDQKNIKGILSAFSMLKNSFQQWRCIIVGPHNPALIAEAAHTDLDAYIEWTGEIAYEKVAMHMQAAHCMVMFSRYENSPCTIIEALSAGLPVIASSVGGIPEIVDCENGILVATEDMTGLVSAMQQMIETYHSFQRGAIAEKAKSVFSYEAAGAQIAALYKV